VEKKLDVDANKKTAFRVSGRSLFLHLFFSSCVVRAAVNHGWVCCESATKNDTVHHVILREKLANFYLPDHVCNTDKGNGVEMSFYTSLYHT